MLSDGYKYNVLPLSNVKKNSQMLTSNEMLVEEMHISFVLTLLLNRLLNLMYIGEDVD